MKRSTIQRKLTLEAVNSLHCHATVEEVYEEVSKEHPSVSRTTVYRNLKDLSDSGEIRKINNSGGADRFDHIVEKHYHVRCDKCGRQTVRRGYAVYGRNSGKRTQYARIYN